MKRYPAKKAPPKSLRVSFGKIDGDLDIVYSWSDTNKCDSRLLHHRLSSAWMGFNGYPDRDDSLLAELIKRGYDIRTLDFKIKKLDDDDEEGKRINEYMLKSLGL